MHLRRPFRICRTRFFASVKKAEIFARARSLNLARHIMKSWCEAGATRRGDGATRLACGPRVRAEHKKLLTGRAKGVVATRSAEMNERYWPATVQQCLVFIGIARGSFGQCLAVGIFIGPAAIRVSRRVIVANSQPWQDGAPAKMRPWPDTPNGLDAGQGGWCGRMVNSNVRLGFSWHPSAPRFS